MKAEAKSAKTHLATSIDLNETIGNNRYIYEMNSTAYLIICM
jgi:hypothetical protein